MDLMPSLARGHLGIPDEVVVRSAASWTIDGDSGVDMPINATEYAAWLASSGLSTWSVPDSLFRCNEGSGSLADSIGVRTFAKTGAGAFAYGTDVTGWATNGVQAPMGSSSDWWSFAGNNLSTTNVAFFLICDLRTLGASRMLFSLGGSSSANATEVYHDGSGAITAKRGGSASASTAYPNDVIGILAVCRPGASDFSVYVKKIGGALETLTPAWSAPPNASHTVYLASGFSFAASDAVNMRVEYWTGANADIDATEAAAFFTARGF